MSVLPFMSLLRAAGEMLSRAKVTYRQPSFLEGVSRLFDILGLFKDEVTFVHEQHHLHNSEELEYYSDDSYYQAIDEAATRVNWQMGLVGNRMRKKLNHLS
jgi:hypothetical protein